MTKVCDQSNGTMPEFNDCWKTTLSIVAASRGISLSRRAGILSGPDALFGFILLMRFTMP